MTSKNTTALTDLHRARGPRALPRRRASLLVEAETVTAIALRESQPVVLGRARPADVVLDERGLSRQHARLVWRGGALEVQDLGSTNGTWVNDARVERASLRPGDALRFGDVHAHLHLTRFDGEERAAAPERFAAALGEELERARAFHRPLAVIALRSENPERSPGWERALRPALRPVDRLAPFGDRVALLALPEVGRAALPAWAERLRAIEPSLALAAAVHPQHEGDPDALIAAALDALRPARPEGPLALAPDEAPAPAEPAPGGAIVVSPPMRSLYELVARAARTKLPILVLGETGVGKELVARALHAKSPRGEGPFKALNCATIPTHLTESVLFGHERGAFTGATGRAAGVFEQADGGTVFLDEVG
ncbi:MAG TPA: FHA domain-containing protein, partial [Polyangiaceae bacterium LLY-WYZ-15_(1-7)]|nr:FHA domain-containing protein [Polyangiaceae bacterium LLY-WYZ-15_(1-7)]